MAQRVEESGIVSKFVYAPTGAVITMMHIAIIESPSCHILALDCPSLIWVSIMSTKDSDAPPIQILVDAFPSGINVDCFLYVQIMSQLNKPTIMLSHGYNSIVPFCYHCIATHETRVVVLRLPPGDLIDYLNETECAWKGCWLFKEGDVYSSIGESGIEKGDIDFWKTKMADGMKEWVNEVIRTKDGPSLEVERLQNKCAAAAYMIQKPTKDDLVLYTPETLPEVLPSCWV